MVRSPSEVVQPPGGRLFPAPTAMVMFFLIAAGSLHAHDLRACSEEAKLTQSGASGAAKATTPSMLALPAAGGDGGVDGDGSPSFGLVSPTGLIAVHAVSSPGTKEPYSMPYSRQSKQASISTCSRHFRLIRFVELCN